MKKLTYLFVLSIIIALTSCHGRSIDPSAARHVGRTVNQFIQGNDVSFKSTYKGHCYDCGLNHYGRYICPKFSRQKGSPTTCECGCPMKRHAKN